MARPPHIKVPAIRPGRKREIAELAEAIADEHFPDSQRVDPLQIAEANDMTYSIGDYGDAFDGMLEVQADHFHIYCNRERCGDIDKPRTRFTIAHELGHYYIDEHRHTLLAGDAEAHQSICDSQSPLLVEQEADLFAANLLMPSKRFIKAGRRVQRGLAGVISLANRFATSLTSTALRYAELELLPCAVIKWSWKGYSWKKLSSSTFDARFRRTIESPDQLAEGSPTRLALAHEPMPERGFLEAGTTASAWFKSVTYADDRNTILMEQAISLGKYGILTMLWPEAGRY